jgi:gamma-glutamylcyclotransferase (GGCT)/AIG2-like uncharacterized protein YtfP
MNANLFVYGSLMSSSRHPVGDRLRREARLIGEASIAGRLYEISWYPGLVARGQPDEFVQGEVYALERPAHALAWLDQYEGLVPGDPDAGEYERVERPVQLATGETIAAWVYLYRKDPAGLRRVASGRWTSPAR